MSSAGIIFVSGMNYFNQRRLLILLLLTGLVTTCTKPDLPENVLAIVGDQQITMEDFKRAYIPVLLYSDKKESLQTREEILNFLINQSVLAQAAYALELDTIPTLKILKRSTEKTAFTRILYKTWVKEHIPEPSESELRTAFKQSHHARMVRHLFSSDKREADRLYGLLARGADWDSLALHSFKEPTLASSGGVLGWMKFGDMDPDFEKAVYQLGIHEISEPINTQFGWHIIRVDEDSKELMLSEYDYQLERRRLRRIIRDRHEQRLADSVANAMMADAHLTFDPVVAPQVWTVLRKEMRQLYDSKILSELTGPELNGFENQLSPLLNEEMLRFDTTLWTVKEFLEKLPEMNRQMMLSNLKKATANLVRDEIIYQEGLELKLDQRADVLGEIRDRKNQFLANLYLRYLVRSRPVSEEMIQTYYYQHASNKYPSPDSLLIHELIFKDSDLAAQGKSALEGGTSVAVLIQQSKEIQHHNLGWFQGARSDRAGYYHRLVNQPLNTVVGPLSSDSTNILILATERKRHAKPLDSIREQVRQDTEEDRLGKLRLNEIQKLTQGLHIRIDLKKLHNLNLKR